MQADEETELSERQLAKQPAPALAGSSQDRPRKRALQNSARGATPEWLEDEDRRKRRSVVDCAVADARLHAAHQAAIQDAAIDKARAHAMADYYF